MFRTRVLQLCFTVFNICLQFGSVFCFAFVVVLLRIEVVYSTFTPVVYALQVFYSTLKVELPLVLLSLSYWVVRS